MQSDLPDTVFAFPEQRKEPLTGAQHAATRERLGIAKEAGKKAAATRRKREEDQS